MRKLVILGALLSLTGCAGLSEFMTSPAVTDPATGAAVATQADSVASATGSVVGMLTGNPGIGMAVSGGLSALFSKIFG